MTKLSPHLKGVSFLLLSLLIKSIQKITIKWISADYSLFEIVFFRSIIALPITLLFLRAEGKKGFPITKQPKQEILRGLYIYIAYIVYFMGLAALPLADVETLRNAAPLMITLLSVIMLREKVGPRRWLALIVGFIGVLLIVRPGSVTFNIGSIFALSAVTFYALTVIVTRKLRTTDSGGMMAFYSTIVFLVSTAILSPIFILIGEIPNVHPSFEVLLHPWIMPSFIDWVIMSGLGILWAGAIYFTARAYSLAEASVITPFEYLSLPMNAFWGFLLWQEVPTWMTIAGAFLTILSGIYVIYRERDS